MTVPVTVRSLAGDDLTSLSVAADWNVLKLKQELSVLTDCPVRQQVLLSVTSATPLANWSRLEELRRALTETGETIPLDAERQTLQLTLLRLERSQTWSDSLDAFCANELQFKDLPPQLQRDRHFILGALQVDGLLLEQMLPEHRADPDLVAVAVAQNPAALDFASCSRPLLLSVLRANGRALQYASKGYRNDPQVVLAAVTSEGEALQHASVARRQDKEIVLAAVRRWGRALQVAAAHLRDDKEVVLAAVQNQPAALQHASIALRDDEEVVFAAASGEPKALQFASERLRSDAQFVRSLRKAKAFRYALLARRQ